MGSAEHVSSGPVWRGLALTLSVWAVGAGFLRAVVVPPEHCPAITEGEATTSAIAAAEWLTAAQAPDGSYTYEYSAAESRSLGGYNEVRHAGVTMSLYQAAAAGYTEYIAAADLGLERMIDNLLRNEDWAALQDPGTGQVKLGSSGLMLAGLAHRRLATGDALHDTLMGELARFIVRMQEPDGALLAFWDADAGEPVPASYSRYYTGEAFWALTLMHTLFPSEGWDRPARKAADYLALYRDEREGIDFKPWADQWAAYGLGEMSAWPGGTSEDHLSDDHLRYARSLAARFGFLVRVESRRTGSAYSELLRGQQSRAAGMGTWGEGLNSLWRIAEADPRMDDLADEIEARGRCAAGMLQERQVSPAEADAYEDPAAVRGAWFRGGVTRMDDQQHALSALLLSLPYLPARRDE
jgi:hypothetical protein